MANCNALVGNRCRSQDRGSHRFSLARDILLLQGIRRRATDRRALARTAGVPRALRETRHQQRPRSSPQGASFPVQAGSTEQQDYTRSRRYYGITNERIGVPGTAVNWRCCPFLTLAERRTKPPGWMAAIQMLQSVFFDTTIRAHGRGFHFKNARTFMEKNPRMAAIIA